MISSQVAEVQIKDNGTIVLTIQVTGITPGRSVEISGNITQSSGASAPFYQISTVPAPVDSGGPAELTVIVPPTELAKDEDVTVIMRVAESWAVTVLGSDQPGQSVGPSAASPWAGIKGVAGPERTKLVYKSRNRWGSQLPPA